MKCVWPCLRTWKDFLDFYSSARIDYISFQRRLFRKRKFQKSCGDETSVGKILEHFRIYGTTFPFMAIASRLYK